MRHREPDERDRRRGVVRRLARGGPPRSRPRGRRSRSPNRIASPASSMRDGQPLHDRVRDRQLARSRRPRSPWTREPRPLDVLDRQRLVESVLVPDRPRAPPDRGSRRRARSPDRPGSARTPAKTRTLARKMTIRAAPARLSTKPTMIVLSCSSPTSRSPANWARIEPVAEDCDSGRLSWSPRSG